MARHRTDARPRPAASDEADAAIRRISEELERAALRQRAEQEPGDRQPVPVGKFVCQSCHIKVGPGHYEQHGIWLDRRRDLLMCRSCARWSKQPDEVVQLVSSGELAAMGLLELGRALEARRRNESRGGGDERLAAGSAA